MCGRYSLLCIDDLGNRFRVHNPMIGARSRFNIAPGSEAPVITRAEGDTRITAMRWGLVPHRADVLVHAPVSINARAETLAEKPLFRHLIRNRRCLVPASGFFEWKTEGKKKVPYYFRLTGTPLFAFAGLYTTVPGADGRNISGYTIITTAPNSLVATVHNRMPMILAREHEETWLADGPVSHADLSDMLSPCPAGDMTVTRVSSLVNNPAIDNEQVVRPLSSSAGTQTFLPE